GQRLVGLAQRQANGIEPPHLRWGREVRRVPPGGAIERRGKDPERGEPALPHLRLEGEVDGGEDRLVAASRRAPPQLILADHRLGREDDDLERGKATQLPG